MSIVNDTALGRFLYNIKNYLTNHDIENSYIKIYNLTNPTSNWTSNTNYRLKFTKMSDNNCVHFASGTNQEGIIQFDEGGKYFFIAQALFYNQNSGNQSCYLKCYHPATGTSGNGISGTEYCQASNYNGGSGSSALTSVILSNEITVAAGDKIGFCGSGSNVTTGINTSGFSVILIKLS